MKKYVALVLVLLLCLSGCFLLPKRARLTKLLYKGVSVIPTTSQDYSYCKESLIIANSDHLDKLDKSKREKNI